MTGHAAEAEVAPQGPNTDDMLEASSRFGDEMVDLIVGEEEAPFQVHQKALTQMSAFMNRVVTGDPDLDDTCKWKEMLRLISPETFTRFRDFAYSGNYSSPEPTMRPQGWQRPYERRARQDLYQRACREARRNNEPPIDLPLNEIESAFGSMEKPPSPQSPYNGVSRPTSIEEAFKRRTFSVEQLAPRPNKERTVKLSGPSDTRSSYLEPALRAHAELCSFAGKLEVDELQLLCLRRIHAILVDCEVTEDTICDVITIVKFNLASLSHNVTLGVGQELMALLGQWFAWRVANARFGRHCEFLNLLRRNTRFLEEFWKNMYDWKLEP